jgi:tetratricopeptide (TPR) repeat protein
MRASSGLFLLVLVGAETSKLQSSLAALRPHVAGWAAIDVGGGASRRLLESSLTGIPGSFAFRPWKGETATREELVRLTPSGEGYAMLMDSSQSITVLPTFDASTFVSDFVTNDMTAGETTTAGCVIFRRSMAPLLSVSDGAFISVGANVIPMHTQGLMISRSIATTQFHSFGTAPAFLKLSAKYVSESKFESAIKLLKGALDKGLSLEDQATIHSELGRIYSKQSLVAQAFLHFSTAFAFGGDLIVEKLEAVVMLNAAKEFRLADSLLRQYFSTTFIATSINAPVKEWQVLLEQGVAKHGLGDLPTARTCFEAIASNPQSPPAFRDLALSNLTWC